MRARRFDGHHVLAFQPGDQVLETLTRYLSEQRIFGAWFTAIGGLRHAQLKYFNTGTMQYEQREIDEQVEVVSLIGNVARYEEKPYIHAHVVLGTREYHTYAGHLGEGTVEPTLELLLTPLEEPLARLKSERTGLGELRPDQPG